MLSALAGASLRLRSPRRPGAVSPQRNLTIPRDPERGAEAGVDSCARSVTHLRDALPRVLVVSLAPAAYAGEYAADPPSRDTREVPVAPGVLAS